MHNVVDFLIIFSYINNKEEASASIECISLTIPITVNENIGNVMYFHKGPTGASLERG